MDNWAQDGFSFQNVILTLTATRKAIMVKQLSSKDDVEDDVEDDGEPVFHQR